ncbi:MAG TPA: alpha-L-fucosidase [Chthoniobacteraceae bacterium]|jgi:alpha-L-fucosidase|nr:alpha-L-fucosidase [Chthoniobacteraceae bacterium]
MFRHLIAALCFILPATGALKAADWPPADPAAVAHWQSLRFGMFIHWGPVSQTAKEISWSRGPGKGQIPVEQYDNLYKTFDPEKFNADEWVGIAKAAGMKYIVLVAKHHDGFCLWDSKYTDYDIMHTPFHRDVAKELSEACKKQGIALGFYYSVPDVHNPDWPYALVGRGHPLREKYNLDAYQDYLQNQVTELIKNYGPLITIWYDSDGTVNAIYGKRGADAIKVARGLQPDILVDNRAGDGGDYLTPEQHIGGFDINRPWESCMTVSAHGHWSWAGAKDGVKPVATCIRMLANSAGGDGNMLLDVGPRPDGIIDPGQAGVLKGIGDWLAANGESIYGTRGGPYKPTKDYASTRKADVIYLHLFNTNGGKLTLPALPVAVKSASILGGGNADALNTPAGLTVTLTCANPSSPDTVVKLTIDGKAMDIPPI